MTQSLTERLQERLATQAAEIEKLTASELHKLGESLRIESEAALASMQSAMAKSIMGTTRPLMRDLEQLRGIGRWWWSALALTWLMLAMLTGFSLWLWASPPASLPTGATGWGTGGTVRLHTFTDEGTTYAMLPEGARVWTCLHRERSVPCIRLPSLEEMLQGTDGTTSEPGGERGEGMDGRPDQGTGGAPTGELGARPPTRPPVRPSGS